MATAEKRQDNSYDIEQNQDWEMVSSPLPDNVSDISKIVVNEMDISIPIYSKVLILGETSTGKTRLSKDIVSYWLDTHESDFYLMDKYANFFDENPTCAYPKPKYWNTNPSYSDKAIESAFHHDNDKVIVVDHHHLNYQSDTYLKLMMESRSQKVSSIQVFNISALFHIVGNNKKALRQSTPLFDYVILTPGIKYQILLESIHYNFSAFMTLLRNVNNFIQLYRQVTKDGSSLVLTKTGYYYLPEEIRITGNGRESKEEVELQVMVEEDKKLNSELDDILDENEEEDIRATWNLLPTLPTWENVWNAVVYPIKDCIPGIQYSDSHEIENGNPKEDN